MNFVFRLKAPEARTTSQACHPSQRSLPASSVDGLPPKRRLRKAHSKSRSGCQECKGRKRKCDEERPRCRACQKRGLHCDYDPLATRKMASCLAGSPPTPLLGMTCSPLPSLATLIDESLRHTSVELNGQTSLSPRFFTEDIDSLRLFQEVTCGTLGTPSIQRIYQLQIPRLAISRPYLMYTALAIAQTHRRHRLALASSDLKLEIPTPSESRYMSLALSSYNERLSAPLTAADAHALLVTSTLLCAVSFASISSTDPSLSWPNNASPSHLDWLKVQQGPGIVLAATAIWLSQSALFSTFKDFDVPSSGSEQNLIDTNFWDDLCSLCEITEASDAKTNPYYAALMSIAPLISLEPSAMNAARFFPFIGSLQPTFVKLLAIKDPRALLILAWWYGLASRLGQWWLTPRAQAECLAIITFLVQTSTYKKLKGLVHALTSTLGFPLT